MELRENNLRFDGGKGNKRDRFAEWFLVLALISGFFISFLTPPMCSPDENAHFMNAYAISYGDFLPEVVDGMPARYVEGRVLNFVWKYNDRFHGNMDEKYSFSEQYFDSYLNDNNTEPVLYATNLNTINPVCYLPSSLFMYAGRLLGQAITPTLASLPYNLLIYGRLGNCLFYVSVIYLALCITPCFRRVMLILAMMPMVLFLGASVNYDAILIPVCFLFIAEVGKLLTEPLEKPIAIEDICRILFCTFFLVGIKQAYAPLLLMLLAVPKGKYGSTKKMIICIALVFLVGIIAYLPVMMINRINAGIGETSNDIYIAGQTEYVKTHLAEMPAVFFNTLRSFKGFYMESFWGKLGQLDTTIPFPYEVIFYYILMIVSVADVVTISIWDRQWKRILPVIAVFISVVGIFGIMYLTWTPLPGIADGVGSQYISGVQGRYLIELFIPCLSVFCFGTFRKHGVVQKLSNTSNNLVYVWTVVCGILTPIIVLLRYYC